MGTLVGARVAAISVSSMLLSTLLLAGCTAQEHVPEPRPTTDAASTAPQKFGDYEEYRDASVDLARSLPPGATFPEVPQGDWEPEESYEAGTGEVAAAMFWRCAWLTTYREATDAGNKESRAVALDRLAEWPSLPEVIANSDTETAPMWLARVVHPAVEGDDTEMRRLAATCDNFDEPN